MTDTSTSPPPPPAVRYEVGFPSGNDECAAWHYPGTNGACVVMAAGLGVTVGPGTDRFAARFHREGFTVLAFEHRRFGRSGGTPRQVARLADQRDDWRAALAAAAALPDVDPVRLGAWGFSLGGGHVVRVAAEHPTLAAAVAQTPALDGPAAARSASRHQRPAALVRTMARVVADTLGNALGRPPRLLPLAGRPGTIALLTTPDAVGGAAALDPDGRYDDWCQQVAARTVLTASAYRPVRAARRVRCPLLVVVADDDETALAGPGVRAASDAPLGELVRVPGGHYAPFLAAHEAVVAAEVAFLRRCLVDPVGVRA